MCIRKAICFAANLTKFRASCGKSDIRAIPSAKYLMVYVSSGQLYFVLFKVSARCSNPFVGVLMTV